jgi:YD repeat-containing protein
MTPRTHGFQSQFGRKVALCGVVAGLALLAFLDAGASFGLAQDRQGSQVAKVQGSMGAGGQSPIPNIQSLDSPTGRQDGSPTSSRTVVYTYDAAGRLVLADYGGGKTIGYSYDAAGNLLQRCTLTVDFSPDGQVNVADVMQVASRWRMTSADPDWQACYDLNGDGIITVVDIMLVVVHWGEACG